ncbi:hypothetical protein ACLB1S_22735 [Escherichia coli]
MSKVIWGCTPSGAVQQRSPVLLALDYNPTGDKEAPVYACLVGKGITFDSGGYSIKQTAFMDSMKSDMGGAATVTGGACICHYARTEQAREAVPLLCG